MMMSVMKTLVLLMTNILLLAIGAPIADGEPPISVNTECAAKVTSGSETGEVHLLDQNVSKNEFQDDEEWCNDCDYKEVEEKLDCDVIKNRPIPDEEMWKLMRRAYIDVVGTEESTPHATFDAPFHVEQTDEKGRGVFATEPIKKGSPISDVQEAVFDDRDSFYKFLKSIPQIHACDVLYWAWTEYQNIPNSFQKRLVLGLNLDKSAMINNSRSKKLANMGCDPEAAKKFEGGCDKYEFALKDIEAGEEILSLYGGFDAGSEAWDSFFDSKEVHLLDQSVSKNEFQDDEEWCNECDYKQLEQKLHCGAIRNRPIPDQEVWRLIRRAYADVVGNEESTPHATFYAPFRVEHTDKNKKGRGVFATEPIKKGAAIWDVQEAVFEDRESLYKFLNLIPQIHACDVIDLAWTEYENVPNSIEKRAVLLVTLDESSMVNWLSKKLTNIGCDPEAAKKFEGGCDKYEFALKDIEAGEEIISLYDAGEDDAWDSFFGTKEALE
eukprot:scaffold75812_cov49-Attheya_sp.AAC.3